MLSQHAMLGSVPYVRLPGRNGVLGHDSALQGYTGPGTTWVNEVNFVVKVTGCGSGQLSG